MRQRQFRLLHRNVVIGDQIDVERARSPVPLVSAVAAEFRFYLLEREQQRVRIEAGFDFNAGIDEVRLLLFAPGRGHIVGRSREQGSLGHAADVGDRSLEGRANLADIAAERDQGAGHQDCRVRVRTTPTSSKIAAIGACGLWTVTLMALTLGKAPRMASATAPAARSSNL